jgi:hypothetical protein
VARHGRRHATARSAVHAQGDGALPDISRCSFHAFPPLALERAAGRCSKGGTGATGLEPRLMDFPTFVAGCRRCVPARSNKALPQRPHEW